MDNAGDRLVEGKGRTIVPLVVIGVLIGLIYLPMAFGLSPKIDFGAHVVRPF